MRIGAREKSILEFLEYPASEDLLMTQFAPLRPKRGVYDSNKVRKILSKMIAKGLITKKGKNYEKILHHSPDNA
jgi:hypothetical protein